MPKNALLPISCLIYSKILSYHKVYLNNCSNQELKNTHSLKFRWRYRTHTTFLHNIKRNFSKFYFIKMLTNLQKLWDKNEGPKDFLYCLSILLWFWIFICQYEFTYFRKKEKRWNKTISFYRLYRHRMKELNRVKRNVGVNQFSIFFTEVSINYSWAKNSIFQPWIPMVYAACGIQQYIISTCTYLYRRRR